MAICKVGDVSEVENIRIFRNNVGNGENKREGVTSRKYNDTRHKEERRATDFKYAILWVARKLSGIITE